MTKETLLFCNVIFISITIILRFIDFYIGRVRREKLREVLIYNVWFNLVDLSIIVTTKQVLHKILNKFIQLFEFKLFMKKKYYLFKIFKLFFFAWVFILFTALFVNIVLKLNIKHYKVDLVEYWTSRIFEIPFNFLVILIVISYYLTFLLLKKYGRSTKPIIITLLPIIEIVKALLILHIYQLVVHGTYYMYSKLDGDIVFDKNIFGFGLSILFPSFYLLLFTLVYLVVQLLESSRKLAALLLDRFYELNKSPLTLLATIFSGIASIITLFIYFLFNN